MSLVTHTTFLLSANALEYVKSYTRTLAGRDARRTVERAEFAVSYGRARLVFLRTLELRDLSTGAIKVREEYLTLMGRVGLADGKKVSLADGLEVILFGRELRTLGLILGALVPSLQAEGGASGVTTLLADVWAEKDLGVRVDSDGVTLNLGGGFTEGLDAGGGFTLNAPARRVTWQREGFDGGERSRLEVWEEGALLRTLDLAHPDDRPQVRAVFGTDADGGDTFTPPVPPAPSEPRLLDPSFMRHLPADTQAELRAFMNEPTRCAGVNASNGLPCAVPAVVVSADSGRAYCRGHAPLLLGANERLLPIG